MNNVIETIDLTRRFRRAEAVDRLTLQVPVGSIFALLGIRPEPRSIAHAIRT